ncbi:intelectin-1-like [Ciona intestinalis]
MLSRTGGQLVTKVQVESTLKKILQPFKTYTWSDSCASNHLVVPVTYTIGKSILNNFVPPSMQLATTTGFLQIRAESYTGTYYAMCPAVKLNSCDGQYVCIGGVKNGYSQTNDCNDLTDWNGLTNNPDYHISKSFAHSSKDIESTIMIFYR